MFLRGMNLEKGLSFSPTQSFDVFETILDLNRFVRNVTLKRNFFQEQTDMDGLVSQGEVAYDLSPSHSASLISEPRLDVSV